MSSWEVPLSVAPSVEDGRTDALREESSIERGDVWAEARADGDDVLQADMPVGVQPHGERVQDGGHEIMTIAAVQQWSQAVDDGVDVEVTPLRGLVGIGPEVLCGASDNGEVEQLGLGVDALNFLRVGQCEDAGVVEPALLGSADGEASRPAVHSAVDGGHEHVAVGSRSLSVALSLHGSLHRENRAAWGPWFPAGFAL